MSPLPRWVDESLLPHAWDTETPDHNKLKHEPLTSLRWCSTTTMSNFWPGLENSKPKHTSVANISSFCAPKLLTAFNCLTTQTKASRRKLGFVHKKVARITGSISDNTQRDVLYTARAEIGDFYDAYFVAAEIPLEMNEIWSCHASSWYQSKGKQNK